MKSYLLYGGFLLGVLALLAILIWSGSRSAIKTTSANDPNRPIAKLAETAFDLGKMSVKDIKEHDFTITNQGKDDLIISRVATSCDCTYAYIIKDGQKSPKFSMMGNIAGWKTNLKSGESATLKVIYEPAIMPVSGKVTRTVTVATNDPVNSKLEATVTAEVQS